MGGTSRLGKWMLDSVKHASLSLTWFSLMAVLELCEVSDFSCSRLIVCLDRSTETRTKDALIKDLGWIGFQLTTLDGFTQGDKITSDQWLLMDMEV